MTDDEVLELYEREHKSDLEKTIRGKYPWLEDRGLLEDILQEAAIVFWQNYQRRVDIKNWGGYLYKFALNASVHAYRLLVRAEAQLKEEELGQRIPLDEVEDKKALPPDEEAIRQERRDRKKRMFGDVLREFVRYCETTKAEVEEKLARRRMKEVYERFLRGEDPKSIAGSMGIDRNYVDQLKKRARDWVFEAVSTSDENESVFVSLFKALEVRPRRPREAEIRYIGEFVRWLVREGGAMCPTRLRLAQYVASEAERREGIFDDVRYHVQTANCPVCQLEIDALRAGPE